LLDSSSKSSTYSLLNGFRLRGWFYSCIEVEDMIEK
jgi:hypothetical protein